MKRCLFSARWIGAAMPRPVSHSVVIGLHSPKSECRLSSWRPRPRLGSPRPRAPWRCARGLAALPSDAPSWNCLGVSGSGFATSRHRLWQRAQSRPGCVRRRLLRCRSARRPAKPLLPLPRLRAGGSGAKRVCGGGRRRQLRLLPLQAPRFSLHPSRSLRATH